MTQMFTFDYYNCPEIPTFYLANPDETVIYSLGTIYNRDFKLRYNALSELTFTAPSKVDNEDVEYYDYLQYRRLVMVNNVGTFVITDVKIDNDGIKEVKNVTCQSYETVLTTKKVSLFKGTYYFNYPDQPQGSLLDELLTYIPGWSIGTVSESLKQVSRTFDVTDKSLYDFMVNEISQTYQCVFVFDSLNKTISAYTTEDAFNETDIFISFNNLMKSMKLGESTAELVTALTVLGGGDLSINQVNPIGTDTIYNFDYYKTTDWMTQDLIDAIDTWEAKIDTNQPVYANLLTDLINKKTEQTTLQSELATLEGEKAALQSVRDAHYLAGMSTAQDDADIADKQAEIDTKENELGAVMGQLTDIQANVDAIHEDLMFENNFTSTQLINLNNFIIGNTYTNTNFIQTDIMSNEEIQTWAQALYDQGKSVLEKVSQPRYTFEIEAANFLFIKDYEPFIEQLALGCSITIETKEGIYTTGALLGIDFSYDDPSAFKMILSNRFRLSDEKFQYDDFYTSILDSTTTTNFNSPKWNYFSDSYSVTSASTPKSVLSTSLSSVNNLCVFSSTNGILIKDVGAGYKEPGAYLPVLVSGSASFTYSTQYGYYTIIGKVCVFMVAIQVSGMSNSSATALQISLPVKSKNATSTYASLSPTYNNIDLSSGYTQLTALVNPNSNLATFYQNGDNVANAVLPSSALNSTSGRIYLSGCYMIN